MKPKLTDRGVADVKGAEMTKVYNIHAIVGQAEQIYVLGILTQREDTHYYLEDSTYSIRLSFSDLQYADPTCFYTENQVLLCKGSYKGDMFHIVSIEQPPLYSSKAREITFKVNQSDYFGAYSKLHRELAAQSVSATGATSALTLEQSNVVQSQ